MLLDETGFVLQPLNRRTWAPTGSRPQQVVSQRHDRLSVIGSLAVSPNRRRVGLAFRIHVNNVRTQDVMRFHYALHRQHRGLLIVVLDRWSVHRAAIKRLRARGASWLWVEWLPAYAPDLNPVEALWSRAKYTALANFVPNDVDHLHDAVIEAVGDPHFNQPLLRSYCEWLNPGAAENKYLQILLTSQAAANLFQSSQPRRRCHRVARNHSSSAP